MDTHAEAFSPVFPSFLLEIVPDDPHDPDPVALQEVGRQVLQDLEHANAQVTRPSTGQKGALELVFQVMMQTMQSLGTEVMAQKDPLDVLAALCTIFTSASPIVTSLLHARRTFQTRQTSHEVKVTIMIDQGFIDLTSSSLSDDERIKHLAEYFLKHYPTTKITPQTKVKVQGRVSQKRRH